jgi:dTDP-4-dehydrorhamnose 3,5-epimerase
MEFTETHLPGVFVIDQDRHKDDRGWFARAWCREAFATQGLSVDLAQCNLSHNARRGTLRGMHFQAAPHAEAKLVRCVAGTVHDVVLDLRPESPTYKQSYATELSAANGRAVFMPEGIAHGFQTLADDSTLFYQMSTAYMAEAATGVRWNDPAFQIDWPLADPLVNERDQAFPDYAS